MEILFVLGLFFVLLLIDDHSRQMSLDQSLSDYMNIEYRHTHPLND